MRKNTKIIIIFFLSMFLFICAAFFVESNSEKYVFYNGTYYTPYGASVSEKQVGDEIGTINRKIFRSFLNKSGDSNFLSVGRKIYENKSDPDTILVATPFLLDGIEEIQYWLLTKNE